MIKVLAQFEHELAGKSCRFLLDSDTAIPVAKELAISFLTAFLKHLENVEENARAQNEAVKQEEIQPVEEKSE